MTKEDIDFLTDFERRWNILQKDIDKIKADTINKISSQLEPMVMQKIAELKKEFDEKFCYSFMENGEPYVNSFLWKSCDNADEVWRWIEELIKSNFSA